MAWVCIGVRNGEDIIVNSRDIFDICVNKTFDFDGNDQYETRVRVQKRDGTLEKWNIAGKNVKTIVRAIRVAEEKEKKQAVELTEVLLQGRLEEGGF